jgi:monoamine oxidase
MNVARLRRRDVLAAGALALAGCSRDAPALAPPARWLGAAHTRGHRLRDTAFGANKSGTPAAAAVQRRAQVLIVGAGISGLSAARAFQRAGMADVHLLELEDSAGGNSRGHQLAGLACPLGAHYLPLPGPAAREVNDWLFEIGLLKSELGRTVANERHLCHSPQERLFIDGAWADGLLPPADPASGTQAQYRRFAKTVADAQKIGFALPSHRAPWTAAHASLDVLTFADWLNQQQLNDERLRWYLDYCCRDDYGAGAGFVSAWAGLHYFASRHGFHAPGEQDHAAEREPVFTWPEGNAWLAQRLAAPFAPTLHTGRTVWRVQEERHGVSAWVWDEAAAQMEHWQADVLVLAVPLFIARRLLASPPAALQTAAAGLSYAPWLVANVHIQGPLLDRPGAPPAWDNVAYSVGTAAQQTLGYVDAMHQSLRSAPGPTVLTFYSALPPGARAQLLAGSAAAWSARVLQVAAALHPDLPALAQQVELMRWGHAMAIPAPGVRSSAALAALRHTRGRVRFAHSDLAGSSVFEEAFTLGCEVARPVQALR